MFCVTISLSHYTFELEVISKCEDGGSREMNKGERKGRTLNVYLRAYWLLLIL